MRFITIKNRDFCKEVISKTLVDYKEINGMTGGDDDFICVDTKNKEWCWCESGDYPFCDDSFLFDLEIEDEDLTLKKLVKMRR